MEALKINISENCEKDFILEENKDINNDLKKKLINNLENFDLDNSLSEKDEEIIDLDISDNYDLKSECKFFNNLLYII